MSFELAQKIADAVLYEGYVLYPYRASAAKNRVRWQFGVVVPRAYAELGGSEPWAMQTEVLVEPAALPEIDVRVRFLQVQARTIEKAEGESFRPVETLNVGDRTLVTWEEGVERQIEAAGLSLDELLAGERRIPIELPESREAERVQAADGGTVGRIVRERWPVSGVVRVAAEPAGELTKVRVRIENLDPWQGDSREEALRRSLVGAHTLLAVRRRDRSCRSAARSPLGRLRQPAYLARPGRSGRRPRRAAVVADHPLRPSGGGAGEPGGPLRLHRDRRDPDIAGDDPDR